MSKIALIGDTHYGSRNDSPIVQQWQQRFLDTVFFPTLDARGVKTVLHAGDYFDRRKYTNHQTLNFVETAYRTPLRARGITEHIIAGNHDCYYRDASRLTAVGEFYRDDPSMVVYTHPTDVTIDGLSFLMLPWITEETRAAADHAIAASPSTFVLGHLELNGFQMYRGVPQHEGSNPTDFHRFEQVFTGHFHHRSSRDNISYLGAPWPMVWSDYRDPRGFALFDTVTHEVEYIDNPYQMFVRVEYDDSTRTAPEHGALLRELAGGQYTDAYVKVVVKQKKHPHWFDDVMVALTKANAQDILVVDDIVVDDTNDASIPTTIDVDTLPLIQSYVEGLTVSCDKLALQEYLRTLYHEAVGMSTNARAN